jgi:crossover junction endodeoxyribonuclease RusA
MILEFIVSGPPVSHQSHNKKNLRAWRDKVRSAAAEAWGSRGPLDVGLRLALTVNYYHLGANVRIDTDNLVKPIQDALIGLVYHDDRLVTRTIVSKASIDGFYQIRGHSLVELSAFSQGDEFLYIVVDLAPTHERPIQ